MNNYIEHENTSKKIYSTEKISFQSIFSHENHLTMKIGNDNIRSSVNVNVSGNTPSTKLLPKTGNVKRYCANNMAPQLSAMLLYSEVENALGY